MIYLSKKRVYELAKELGLSSKELINGAKTLNISINTHMSTINPEDENKIKEILLKKEEIIIPKKQKSPINREKQEVKKEPIEKNVQRPKPEAKKTPIEKNVQRPKPEVEDDFEDTGKADKEKVKKTFTEKKTEKKNKKRRPPFKKRQTSQEPKKQIKFEYTKPIKIGETISVKNLSEKISKPIVEIIKKLLLLGVVATINQDLEFETASLIASEYGATLEKIVQKDDEESLINDFEDKPEDLKPRPPVVTIMGHVDHGKTSLLDAIRETNVIATEAGGITQHIGAYTVNIEGKKIVFLDTPGHEAFTSMRARGAKVTDIAILVVAADDGVMPQTVEAINHAKAANVTIIVAINKTDKPGANIDRVKQELTEHGLLAEDWGGDTICVPVSAKNKTGIENLLEMVLLVAEMQELKANPNRKAKGTVIEAKLDKSRGPVATILIQNGTLSSGDYFIVGTTCGKIRTMLDDKGKPVKKANPSTPIEITGLTDVPDAGDIFIIVSDEKTARLISEKRKEQHRLEHLQSNQKISLEELFSQIQEGKVKELNIIVKADVQGSAEALKQSLERLSNDEVKIKTIHSGVGAITETDVMFASASNAIIIGFNVRPQPQALALADKDKVDISLYRVIYNAIEDIEAAMKGMLDPEWKEVVLGHAEVRAIFKASSIGTIAGSYVTDGKITRNSEVRIVRDGIIIYEGKIASLKRFKDDAREVNSGFECGISLEKFNDIKEGDIIESFVMEAVKR